MQMVTCTKENESMTKLTAMEPILIPMGLNMLDSEKKINNMEKAQKLDLIKHNITAIMSTEKSMEMANLCGLMVQSMKESLEKIIFMDKELINGQMAGFSLANGNLIRWMERENLHDLMVGHT